jgi:hypothetical protein
MRFGRSFVALCGLAVSLVLIAPNPSWAQLRTLPAKAKRATLNGYQSPFVVLGNERLRLSPGAVIYDTHNRTIVPLALPAEADVVFTTDNSGAVVRIYLLTPQERQSLDQAKR